MFKIMNIFSIPSIQIIRYLGRRYRDGYYVREISRNLGISLGSASQSLRTLEEAGLVLKEHRGRLVIYRANMQNFVLREFKILLTLLEIDPFIMRLKEVSTRIILFGSCAAGEDTIDSDIDIFINPIIKEQLQSFMIVIRRRSPGRCLSSFRTPLNSGTSKPRIDHFTKGLTWEK